MSEAQYSAFGGWVWNHARPAPTLTWDGNGQVVRVQTKSFWIDTPTDDHLIELGFEKMAVSAEILQPTTLQSQVNEALTRLSEARLIARQPLAPLVPPLLREILDERARQDEIWGVQHHPSFPKMVDTPVARSIQSSLQAAMAQVVQLVKATVDVSEDGQRAWAIIFFEEVLEALNEVNDWQACRKELVQCAAVILNWVNDEDERQIALDEQSKLR